MSPLFQTRLLLPLLEAIRGYLGAGESAALNATPAGSPYIETHTERGSMIAAINAEGLYAFDTPGGLYACDPHGRKDTICDMIRQALTDAREEQA